MGVQVGAEVRDGWTTFRVWAPTSSSVAVIIEGGKSPRRVDMVRRDSGHFDVTIEAGAGTTYRYLLDDGESYPDPASRFQPEGPHGPSEIIDSSGFEWTDEHWTGPSFDDLVVYELHVGTFTEDGTWRAAAERLPDLRDLGVTVVEMMPVADFPGRFGWGYDGVNFFAPTRLYGRPDDLRAFIDRAHALHIAVILDVVYNHAGPDGCRLDRFTPRYFAEKVTEWGRAFNFDGSDAGPVRAYFEQNAAYWIREFHFDGLRLDATQQMFDSTRPHIVQTVADAARQAARGRTVWIVAENETQVADMVREPHAGGFGLDALWNDDLHHSAVVAATGVRDAYYTDYLGTASEFVAAALRGFLYQGQWYTWQKQPRGTSTRGLPPRAFVGFLENHDQVANSLDGAHIHQRTPPGRYRALAAMILLGPWVPMLFQGQEFAASTPFLFFADHRPPLSDAVARGRAEFLQQFPSIAAALQARTLVRPDAATTFGQCKLRDDERDARGSAWRLHQSLLALRRQDPAIRGAGARGIEAAVLGPSAFVFRYAAGSCAEDRDRLLVVNLGESLALEVAPEPLLAWHGAPWRVLWSSDDVAYGGVGTLTLKWATGWQIPGESAWLLG